MLVSAVSVNYKCSAYCIKIRLNKTKITLINVCLWTLVIPIHSKSQSNFTLWCIKNNNQCLKFQSDYSML